MGPFGFRLGIQFVMDIDSLSGWRGLQSKVVKNKKCSRIAGSFPKPHRVVQQTVVQKCAIAHQVHPAPPTSMVVHKIGLYGVYAITTTVCVKPFLGAFLRS